MTAIMSRPGNRLIWRTMLHLVVAFYIAALVPRSRSCQLIRHAGFEQPVGRINMCKSVHSSFKTLFSVSTFLFLEHDILVSLTVVLCLTYFLFFIFFILLCL